MIDRSPPNQSTLQLQTASFYLSSIYLIIQFQFHHQLALTNFSSYFSLFYSNINFLHLIYNTDSSFLFLVINVVILVSTRDALTKRCRSCVIYIVCKPHMHQRLIVTLVLLYCYMHSQFGDGM